MIHNVPILLMRKCGLHMLCQNLSTVLFYHYHLLIILYANGRELLFKIIQIEKMLKICYQDNRP